MLRQTFRCPLDGPGLTRVSSGFFHCSTCDRVVADMEHATPEEAARWLQLQGGSACIRGNPRWSVGTVLLAMTAASAPVAPLAVALAEREPATGPTPVQHEPEVELDEETMRRLMALGGYMSR